MRSSSWASSGMHGLRFLPRSTRKSRRVSGLRQITPSYIPPDSSGSGGPRGRGNRSGQGARGGPPVASSSRDAPPTEINELLVDGLYHANAKTEDVDSKRLGDFLSALAETPIFQHRYFENGRNAGVLHHERNRPLFLRAKIFPASSPETTHHPAGRSMKNLSRFDLGVIIAFVVISLLGAGAWYYLSGQLDNAKGRCFVGRGRFRKVQQSASLIYPPPGIRGFLLPTSP